MRRRFLALMIGMGLAVAAWMALQAVADWQVRSGLRASERDLRAGQVGDAQARLVGLARRWPGRGDLEYFLGICAMLGGHEDDALRAWGRVPDRAGEAPRANLFRGRLALETGRYGLAERCLERARRVGGDIGAEARRLLGSLCWITGRRDEVRSLLQGDVERMRDPSEILRKLWSLDHDPYPVDKITQSLEKAKRAAPDDDRVWLALADLATRVGHFEEADDWLRRCERARPDDSAVWRARLRWSRAAGRPDEVARAASHLPRSSWSQASGLELRAWMAARSGDRRAERAALESFITLEPGDAAAMERLADLAALAGEKERVAELRRRKADIQDARDRYEQLIIRPELVPHAAALARAAELIGRRFDAQAWWRIAAERDHSLEPEAAAARIRLAKAEPAPLEGGETLADLLGPIRSPGTDKEAVPSEPSVATFAEDADRRGVVFTLENGRSDLHQLPETMCGGVALLDFDGDGWLDLYAIQGGSFPPPAGPAPFGDRLFRNRGDGRFEDVTVSSGLAKLPGGYGHGVAVGDYDNDGRPDLFVTRWRSYALYHNLGQGRFKDVTTQAGLGGDRDWPTSAAWADLDNDGDLDLYVCHYLRWDTVNPPACTHPGAPERGHSYCDPRRFDALPDHVFRNDGSRFVDVTEKAGLVDHKGRGLGVVAADLDDDGTIDLFVANDMTANYFLRNRGAWRFSEEGLESGLATGAEGGYLSGMGVACGDFDGDGRLDLAVTNFVNQSTTLYHNHGGGIFSERSAEIGLAAATRLVLGFGLAALDANNDGWLDLVQANGDVEDYRPAMPYAMRPQLFLGDGTGRLIDVSERAGPPWQVPRIARGLAVGDLDNDGRVDVVIISQNAPLAVLHNQSPSQNHSLTLLLEGTASNRDAVGARVTVTAAGRTQVAARFGGGSYQSASDPRLHFGLGPARVVDRVEVTWPSGRRNCYHGLVADTGYRLREGDPFPKTLAGFSAAIKR
jgi:hypothetical protein